jgi:hypothetical protein
VRNVRWIWIIGQRSISRQIPHESRITTARRMQWGITYVYLKRSYNMRVFDVYYYYLRSYNLLLILALVLSEFDPHMSNIDQTKNLNTRSRSPQATTPTKTPFTIGGTGCRRFTRHVCSSRRFRSLPKHARHCSWVLFCMLRWVTMLGTEASQTGWRQRYELLSTKSALWAQGHLKRDGDRGINS